MPCFFGASYKYKSRYFKIDHVTFDISVFLLHPVKTITTGEGEFVCTNNSKFYKRMKEFKNHNIIRKKINIGIIMILLN